MAAANMVFTLNLYLHKLFAEPPLMSIKCPLSEILNAHVIVCISGEESRHFIYKYLSVEGKMTKKNCQQQQCIQSKYLYMAMEIAKLKFHCFLIALKMDATAAAARKIDIMFVCV